MLKSFCVDGVRAARVVGGAFKGRCYGTGPIEVPLTADHYQIKRGNFASVSTIRYLLLQTLKAFFR